MSVTRQIVAFALAPAVPALLFLVALYLTGSAYTGGFDALVLYIALSVSYLSSFFFGVPLIWVLRRKRSLNIVCLSIGGAALGAIVFYIFGVNLAASLDSARSVAPELGELLYGAVLGILVALPFGLIAGYPLIGKSQELE